MPKSMNVSFQAPLGCIGDRGDEDVAGCGSAWKKPLVNSWSNITEAKTGATFAGSMPAARSATASVILIAVTSSSTSTRRVLHSQATPGASTRSSSAKSAAKRSAFAASCR